MRYLKFSQFVPGGNIVPNDITVGLRDGDNTQFNANSGSGGGNVVINIVHTNPFSAADIGKAVRVTTSGDYVLALADSAENAEVAGILTSWTDSTHFSITQVGFSDIFTGLVEGNVYFLSDAIPGELTLNEPNTNSSVVKPLVLAHTATLGEIYNMRGNIVGSTGSGGGGGGGGNSGYQLLGYLDSAGDFSSTTILTEEFNTYFILLQAGPNNSMPGLVGGIFANGGGNASIGFQLYAGGIYRTTNMSHYVSGVNSSAGVNTATLWGDVHNLANENSLVVLPAISNYVGIGSGNAYLSIFSEAAYFNYNFNCADAAPISPVGYTCQGTAGTDVLPVRPTGLRLFFGGGATILPSDAYFVVYGLPNS